MLIVCPFGHNMPLRMKTGKGVKPSEDAQRIMRLYSRGEIDYETAQFAIRRLYQ